MPNWCQNILSLTAISKEGKKNLKEFVDKAKGKGTELSMQNIFPCPQKLIDTDSTHVFSLNKQENAAKIIEYNKSFNWNCTESQLEERIENENKIIDIFLSNISEFGHKDWYDWRVERWGTKWDIEAKILDISKDDCEYDFDSAWSPPIAFIKEASKLFPDIEFKLQYSEEGVGFSGCDIYLNGKEQ